MGRRSHRSSMRSPWSSSATSPSTSAIRGSCRSARARTTPPEFIARAWSARQSSATSEAAPSRTNWRAGIVHSGDAISARVDTAGGPGSFTMRMRSPASPGSERSASKSRIGRRPQRGLRRPLRVPSSSAHVSFAAPPTRGPLPRPSRASAGSPGPWRRPRPDFHGGHDDGCGLPRVTRLASRRRKTDCDGQRRSLLPIRGAKWSRHVPTTVPVARPLRPRGSCDARRRPCALLRSRCVVQLDIDNAAQTTRAGGMSSQHQVMQPTSQSGRAG
jgi:hypothetical protein